MGGRKIFRLVTSKLLRRLFGLRVRFLLEVMNIIGDSFLISNSCKTQSYLESTGEIWLIWMYTRRTYFLFGRTEPSKWQAMLLICRGWLSRNNSRLKKAKSGRETSLFFPMQVMEVRKVMEFS